MSCLPDTFSEKDARLFQTLDFPIYIDATRTPNWSPSLPTDFPTLINAETEAQSCVGGDVGCNGSPAIASPANGWTGPNDATFPHTGKHEPTTVSFPSQHYAGSRSTQRCRLKKIQTGTNVCSWLLLFPPHHCLLMLMSIVLSSQVKFFLRHQVNSWIMKFGNVWELRIVALELQSFNYLSAYASLIASKLNEVIFLSERGHLFMDREQWVKNEC